MSNYYDYNGSNGTLKGDGTHTSYHNSGKTNYDYTGKSGTEHIHDAYGNYVQKWENNPDAGGKTLYKGTDGVWRYADGTVFRGRT